MKEVVYYELSDDAFSGDSDGSVSPASEASPLPQASPQEHILLSDSDTEDDEPARAAVKVKVEPGLEEEAKPVAAAESHAAHPVMPPAPPDPYPLGKTYYKQWDYGNPPTYYSFVVIGPHENDNATHDMFPNYRQVLFDDDQVRDVDMTDPSVSKTKPAPGAPLKKKPELTKRAPPARVTNESAQEFLTESLRKVKATDGLKRKDRTFSVEEALTDLENTGELVIIYSSPVSTYPNAMQKVLGWPTGNVNVDNFLSQYENPPPTGPPTGRKCPSLECSEAGLALTRFHAIQGPPTNRRPVWKCLAGGDCDTCPICLRWLRDIMDTMYGVKISKTKASAWLKEHGGIIDCQCAACNCNCPRKTFIADPSSERRAERTANKQAEAVDAAVLGAQRFPHASAQMQRCLGGISKEALKGLPVETLSGSLAPAEAFKSDLGLTPAKKYAAELSKADATAMRRVGTMFASQIATVKAATSVARERRDEDTSGLKAAAADTANLPLPQQSPAQQRPAAEAPSPAAAPAALDVPAAMK